MADIVAVYDRRWDRAQALGRYTHAPAYTGNLDEMLTKERPDVVSVCTPPWLHASQAIAALESGASVLVEKPMAMTEADCRTMSNAASRYGQKLCIAHNFLFSRAISEVARRVDEGRSGEVVSVLGFQMSTPRRRLPDWYDVLPGQLFFDEAPHLLYLTRRFLGPEEPVLRNATTVEAPREAVQRTQNVAATVTTVGALGVLSMTFNASRAEWGLSIVGSRESYLVDLFRDQFLCLGRGGRHQPSEVLAQTLSGLAQMAAGSLASGALYATHRLLYGHQVLVERFLESVERDGTPPVPGEEGRRTIDLLAKICDGAGIRTRA